MKDLSIFLERDTTYSPSTVEAYRFTRPFTKGGEFAEYFELMLDVYFNMNISSDELTTRTRRSMYTFSGPGMSITMQNLRMQSLMYMVDGEYFLTGNGLAYIVAALRNYAEVTGESFGSIVRRLREEFSK